MKGGDRSRRPFVSEWTWRGRIIAGVLEKHVLVGYAFLVSTAYDEIIEFIASGTSSQSVVEFVPSEESRDRVTKLIESEKTSGLSTDERSELDHYLQLEHIMRLAKARARKHLTT